ncbi:hypothetical protein [Burkholderia sp. TSV86]
MLRRTAAFCWRHQDTESTDLQQAACVTGMPDAGAFIAAHAG